MTKSDGIHYERLVASVFRRMHDQDIVRNLDVQHNVTLRGIAGSRPHQIDIYWRFEIGGIEYSMIAEVKAWKSAVKKSVVMALESLLRDVPGQPRGLIVSRSGFQSGAIQFAKAHGIELYTLVEESPAPTKISLIGWAKLTVDPVIRNGRLIVSAEIFDPEVRNISIELAPEGLTTETRQRLKEQRFDCSLMQVLYDEQGRKVMTLASVIREHVKPGTPVGKHTFVQTFDDPTFYRPFVGETLQIRARQVTFDVVLTSRVEDSLSRERVAELVLTNVHNGAVQRFKKLT